MAYSAFNDISGTFDLCCVWCIAIMQNVKNRQSTKVLMIIVQCKISEWQYFTTAFKCDCLKLHESHCIFFNPNKILNIAEFNCMALNKKAHGIAAFVTFLTENQLTLGDACYRFFV